MKTVPELKHKKKLLEIRVNHIDTLIEEQQENCDHDYEHNERSSISYFSETCDKCDKTRWI